MLLGVIMVLMAVALVGPAHGDKARAVPMFGINHEFVWTPDREIPALIDAMIEANVQAVRIPMRWTMVEPERGKWDFAKMDRVMRALKAATIEILPVLMSVPVWASEITPEQMEGFYDCYPPKNMEDWAEFVRQCVTRYKNDIRYWEVWNEPNGPDFYKPLPDAEEYVRILKTSYEVIKKEDPKATVVLGGLQMNGIIPNPWLPIKIEDFLQKIYDAGGRPYFEIANIHPYVTTAPEEGVPYLVQLVKDTLTMMKKNGDGRKPLWITETGTIAEGADGEKLQAEHLKGTYRELGKLPRVASIYWFTLRDYPEPICGGEDSMGLISNDGRRKPAFEAYKALAGAGSQQ